MLAGRSAAAASDALAAWKFFAMLPRMLLRRAQSQGRSGRFELEARFDAFQRGEWSDLLATQRPQTRTAPSNPDAAQRGRAAGACVAQGEVSRARQKLVGAALAPGTDDTFQKLQEKRPVTVQRPLNDDILGFTLDEELILDRRKFIACLKSAPRGSAAGPGGCSYELLRVLLEDPESLELLAEAAEAYARARLPAECARAWGLAAMTALRKKDDGVRGIAAGASFLPTPRGANFGQAARWRNGGNLCALPFCAIHTGRH